MNGGWVSVAQQNRDLYTHRAVHLLLIGVRDFFGDDALPGDCGISR